MSLARATLAAARPVPTARARRRASRPARDSSRLPATADGGASAPGGDITVTFALHASLNFGASLAVVGSAASLGAWSPENAAALTWTEGDVWVGSVAVAPSGEATEFKFLVVSKHETVWEEGENRVIPAFASGGVACAVTGTFGGDVDVKSAAEAGASGSAAVAVAGSEVTPAAPAAAPSSPPEISPPPATSTAAVPSSSPAVPAILNPKLDLTAPVEPLSNEWRGREVRFYDYRDKDGEIRETEEVKNQSDGGAHLAPDSAARRIAEGSRSAPSWLNKLELVASMIGQGHALTADKLAATSCFIRWVSVGTIRCAEDGDHHRPNRMAEVARDVFVNVETVAGELYSSHGENVGEVERQLMRQIHPWLPSFSSEFTCSVPMTRIRDIAHRNDIPQELKKEIKHTLQNKIHRNAGPEDLVAVEAMLHRVTEHPGQYSQGFVDEFVTFAAELRRFFNAAGALERVDALRPSMEEPAQQAIDELQHAMWELDGGNAGHDGIMGTEGGAVLRASRASVACRSVFTRSLATGLRNDAPDDAVSQRQAYRLAEIALEELEFVVLARALACSGAGVDGENDGGSSHFERLLRNEFGDGDRAWYFATAFCSDALKHLALTGWRAAECNATANELTAWGEAGGVIATKEGALRVRASLQRANRLVEAHTAALVDGFGDVPTQLASCFGDLPPHVGPTHVDAVVRAGVPFQLSRFLATMLRVSSDAAGVTPGGYDAIVLGTGVGVLTECDALEPGAVGDPATSPPVVALVWDADGDEEVSAAGSHVKGIVLARDLPHLSHLAIRARQEKVPLAATEDANSLAYARSLLGKNVALKVEPDGKVSLAEAAADVAAAGADEDASGSPGTNVAASDAKPLEITLCSRLECFPLSAATPENAGAKASVCGELALVAARSDSLFRAPPGVFVPFGVMEASAESAGVLADLEAAVDACDAAAKSGDADAVEVAAKAARDVVEAVPFPPDLAARIAAAFAGESSCDRVVVRSSANVEDLAGMSAAGLYESVLGVSATSSAELGAAVREVWASLYSRRAVLARHFAGVPQRDAKMAVLVQEMTPSELSFVLHTRAVSGASENDPAPVPGSPSPTLEAEIAVGLGETLASGARGSPWRLEVEQSSGEVRTTAFASLGTAKVLKKHAPHLGVMTEAVDYSTSDLSKDERKRTALGLRLAAIGAALEAEYGAPQDIEGGVVGDDVFIVQSRPQPL